MSQKAKILKKKWTSKDIQLFCMAGLCVPFLIVFAYLPMSGIVLAFKDGNKSLNVIRALFEANWTLNNFTMLFNDTLFWEVFFNTLNINILLLLINFPIPIIFALLLNEIRCDRLKKGIQTVANFPHFLSWVIYGGIVIALTNATTGVVNPILNFFRISSLENPVDLNLAEYFYPKIIISTIIKGTGWGAIIYIAAISGINPEINEAAVVDGANRFKIAIKITLPLIKATITIFLLLNISHLLSNSFEQFYVFQTTQNLSRTRVLSTYIYTLSFTYRNYSTATALSLFEGVLMLGLLIFSNFTSKKISGRGIF